MVCLNSTEMDTVQNYFILCAQNINECVHCACIFTAEISSAPARLVPGYSTIDHENRRACQGLCQRCQGSNKHWVVLLWLVVT